MDEDSVGEVLATRHQIFNRQCIEPHWCILSNQNRGMNICCDRLCNLLTLMFPIAMVKMFTKNIKAELLWFLHKAKWNKMD
jgi:hypothetical protein